MTTILKGWRVFGRPIKPLALGLLITMLSFAGIAYNRDGVLGNTIWAQTVAVVAAATAGVLLSGWLARSQKLAEVGLLMSFFVWFSALLVFALTVHPSWEHYAWSTAFAVMAAGSYFLEINDPTRPLDL